MNKEELNSYIKAISPAHEDIVHTCIIDPDLEKLDTKTKKIINSLGASTLFEFILLSVSNPVVFRNLGEKSQQTISEYLKKYGVKTEEISDDLKDYNLEKRDYIFIKELCQTEGRPRRITLYNLYSLYLQYRLILTKKSTLFSYKDYPLEYFYNIPREYLRNVPNFFKGKLEEDYQRIGNILNNVVNQIKEKNPKFTLSSLINEIYEKRELLKEITETLEENERLIGESEMLEGQIETLEKKHVKHKNRRI